MNYGDLKTAVLDDTHRSDLSGHVARFVRQAEGLIRRDLRGYILRTTLTDANRISNGIYATPTGLLEIRDIALQGRQGDSLTRVSPGQIRRLDTTADVVQYAQLGNESIEFRGVPGTADIFDLLYFGAPTPFASDTDENDLLTDHESLYMAGAKFFLYLHTQDRELANDELDIFRGIIATLNEQVARRIGGPVVAPVYDFSGGSAY